MTPTTPLAQAAALAYLAFDATRASVVDVDFAIDVVVSTDGALRRQRYDAGDLTEAGEIWHDRLRNALATLPMGWAATVLEQARGS